MPTVAQSDCNVAVLARRCTNTWIVPRQCGAFINTFAIARVKEIGPETRFDAAYRAITQIGLAALMIHGFRPDTNRPGHHATIIQTLSFTLGMPSKRLMVLDTLRRKRNLADYTGEDIDEASVAAYIAEAAHLLEAAVAWTRRHRPDLAIE